MVPLHCICTIFPNWKLKIKVPFDHHKISWPWLNVFILKIYQNVKKSSSLSKIVNNNAKLFIYITTIKADFFAEKMNIYCTFTTAWHFATLWKKSPTQIFWKTFKGKRFVVLDIARKLRIVTILLMWLWAYYELTKFDWNIF